MPYKIIMIACEGQTEVGIANELIDLEKISLKIADIGDDCSDYEITTEHVHPGVIDTWFNINKDDYDVVLFLVDKDVEYEVSRAESVALKAKSLGLIFIPLFQDPHMETFLAACFEDFTIDESKSTKEIKIDAENFLKAKMGIKKVKKLTITDIKNKGGDTRNAHRYRERFDILSLLK